MAKYGSVIGNQARQLFGLVERILLFAATCQGRLRYKRRQKCPDHGHQGMGHLVMKAREPARILVAVGDKGNDSPHLEYKQRWVKQFSFYVNDQHWGRMFVRTCPYFPFSGRVCLNQHHWLAIRMREEGIDFQQCTNAFLKCSHPARLQELADSLTTQDLLQCGQKWPAAFTPFITDKGAQARWVSASSFLFPGGVLLALEHSHASTYPLTSRGVGKASGHLSSTAAQRSTNSPSGCWI